MFETNFINPVSAPASLKPAALLFASSLATSAAPDDDYLGMTSTSLSYADNQKIIEAAAGIGIRNVDKDCLKFFIGEPSEAYIQKLRNSSSREDNYSAQSLVMKRYRGATALKNEYDGRYMLFIFPEDLKIWAAECGINVQTLQRAVTAHELTHEITPGCFVPNKSKAEFKKAVTEEEWIADYVAFKATDPEAFMMYCFYRYRLSQDFFDQGKLSTPDLEEYAPSCDGIKKAFEDVVSSIDQQLGSKISGNPLKNPFTEIEDRIRHTDFKQRKTTVKTIVYDRLYKFFDENIRGREGAPFAFVDFMKRIIGRFIADTEIRLKPIIAARLAVEAKR